LKLKYGKKIIGFAPPESVRWQILEKDLPFSPDEEETIVGQALEALIEQLEKAGTGKKAKLLLVVPDHTRKCRVEFILPRLLHALDERFSAHVDILIANGSHAQQPEETIRSLVGPEVYQNYPVTQHDYLDTDSQVCIGSTSHGTPLWLNRKIKEADYIITIGGTLYHYFAGFGGGPKMLFPGIAGYESIKANHRRTIDALTGQFHSHCYEGNITTNPVYLDLAEVVEFVPNALSFQVVSSPQGAIVFAESGEILPIHKRACQKVAEVYSLPLKEKADVVIASAGGFPADVNLIQTHKSIHHGFQAVKEGGCLIVVAQCAEGIGSMTFLPYFDFGSSAEIAAQLLRDYRINGHTALALKTKTEKATIIFVSRLNSEIVKKTGMIPASTLAEAWELVASKVKKKATGYILPAASVFVPIAEPPKKSQSKAT
jgi:nickel-dependent lactate racemase